MEIQNRLGLGIGGNPGNPGKRILVMGNLASDARDVLNRFGYDKDAREGNQVLVFPTITTGLGALTTALSDELLIAPGSYDETVTVSKANVRLIGLGGRGAVFIEPSAAGAEGMQVTADDVTLINVGVDGDDTADYALNLNSVSRFRAEGCKIESGGGTGIICLINGTTGDQTADALFRDCEFAWGGKAVVGDDSTYGYPTQIFFDKCHFHNITTHMFGVNTGGLFKNLHVRDCFFGNLEDNTPPTDYILLSDNGNTGFFAGNFFATATNATGVLTIGSGIMWGPNGTEAGWSTARPA
jgi:hypothetical protein